MDIQEKRRAALKGWIERQGGHAKVVAANKLSPSQASYLSQIVNGYSFGEKSARTWEAHLGLPRGWLDAHGAREEVPPPYLSQEAPPAPPSLAEALEVLGMAIAAVPEAQRQELADDMRQWALYGGRDKHRAAVADSLVPRTEEPSKQTGT